MDFKDFFIENRVRFLNVLIRTQIKQFEEYQHDSNIQVGVAYQNALLTLDKQLQPSSQRFNDVKHDIMFQGEKGEVKTGFYNFNYRNSQTRKKWGDKCVAKAGRLRFERVPYRKYKGDSDFIVEGYLPDWILIYQKYDLKRGIPAAVGVIDQDRLRSIFDIRRFQQTRGDLILRVNREDFGGLFYCAASIPEVCEEKLHRIISDNKVYYKTQLELANERALDECLTGNYHSVVGGEEGELDGRSLSLRDEAFMRNLFRDSFSITDISTLSGFTTKAVEYVLQG